MREQPTSNSVSTPGPLAAERDRLRVALERVRLRYSLESLTAGELRDMARDMRDIAIKALRGAATFSAQHITPREGDNRDVSTERRRIAAAVSGTPESDSRSDPSEDARTPAGSDVASPAVSRQPGSECPITLSGNHWWVAIPYTTGQKCSECGAVRTSKEQTVESLTALLRRCREFVRAYNPRGTYNAADIAPRQSQLQRDMDEALGEIGYG